MKVLAQNASWTLYSDFGRTVKEGTVPGKANAAGQQLTFKVEHHANEFSSAYVRIIAAPDSMQSADAAFWDYNVSKIGGQVRQYDFEGGWAYFDSWNDNAVEITLNADNIPERDLKLSVLVYEEFGDWFAANPKAPVLSTTITVLDDDTIKGTPAANRLVGNTKSDIIDGLGGNDTVLGGAGHDTINGGFGNDSLLGGAGHDALYGDSGNDRLFGGADTDALDGGSGNDRLHGDAGNDTLNGAAGRDYLEGGAGKDQLWGGASDDRLTGGLGDDLLYGEVGRDRLQGDKGHDTLIGGAGNDVQFGGAGNDTFVFYARNGRDTIKDFRPNYDKIEFITDEFFASFDDLSIRQSGANTVVKFEGTTVVLEGAKAARLDAADFAFTDDWMDPYAPQDW